MKIEFISSELLTAGSAVPLALSYPVKIEKRPTCSPQWSDGRNGLQGNRTLTITLSYGVALKATMHLW